MPTPAKTKQEQIFALLDKNGGDVCDARIKAIVRKASTRSSYVSRWRKVRGLKPPEWPARVETGEGGTHAAPLPPTPPMQAKQRPAYPSHDLEGMEGDEAQGNGDEGESRVGEEGGEGEAPPGRRTDEESPGEGQTSVIRDQSVPTGKRLPPVIAGQGLLTEVRLSIKTLALYEVAKSIQLGIDPKKELTLGDFLDTCVEDFYQGRGMDLGLITAGGNNGH